MIDLKKYVRDIPDFPKKGIIFKDITPLLADPTAFEIVTDRFTKEYADKNLDAIIGIDARGFIFGGALAYRLGLGFIPVRKKGKLPYKTVEQSYELEYGSNVLEMHEDAISDGDRVVICDDLIATGGTIAATIDLIEKLGGEVIAIAALIELKFLNGREKFADQEIFSLIEF